MKKLLIAFLVVSSYSAEAQRISNTVLYRNIGSPKYFRLHYENDYFSTSDLYYTQGINLEYVHPAIAKFFTSKLLIRSASKEFKVGMSLEQEGYTPTSISHPEILFGDRPFAAALFLKTFSTVNNPARKERISSALSVGALGPVTGGKEIQDALHKLIHYTLPQGWENQISNGVILNYEVEYERRIATIENYFVLSARAGARAGTFNTKAYGSVVFLAGYCDDPFIYFSKQKRKVQAYVYAEPLLNVVAHDATLQGALFSNSNPYTIPSEDISRLVFQANAGLVLKLNTLQLEYFQSYLTKEFATGDSHVWGGIRIGWYISK